jgi:membrane protein insertase Oxa1/YidC/SpoIIIJ
MEKLKKQYANDEKLYNQKVMEMQREGGFSVFAACLPMIVSLIIFIVAINAFNAFAQYSNVKNYNTLVNAYNENFYEYAPDFTEENTIFIENEIIDPETGNIKEIKVEYTVADNEPTNYIYYKGTYTVNEQDAVKYKLAVADPEKAFEVRKERVELTKKEYYADVKKITNDVELMTIIEELSKDFEGTEIEKKTFAVRAYFRSQAQLAVKETYEKKVSKNTQFLWIKNVWSVDATYKHPVLSYSAFKSEAKQEKFKVDGIGKVSFGNIQEKTGSEAYKRDAYNDITAELGSYKKQSNGYFILIGLSIGTILLQQVVMQRSQKEQQQYQTVDGQGKGQGKMMMIIMTGMFAIFSFMYSSAFSIYMITSNLFSMVSTLVINFFVDRSSAKKEAAAVEKRFANTASDRVEAAKRAGIASAENKRKKN